MPLTFSKSLFVLPPNSKFRLSAKAHVSTPQKAVRHDRPDLTQGVVGDGMENHDRVMGDRPCRSGQVTVVLAAGSCKYCQKGEFLRGFRLAIIFLSSLSGSVVASTVVNGNTMGSLDSDERNTLRFRRRARRGKLVSLTESHGTYI
jgi:hypothetical protein